MSRVIVTDIKVPRKTQRFSLHHLTDVHDGSRHHDEKAFDARVAEIAADPFALWIGGGDYGDLIAHNDPRFQADMLSDAYVGKANMGDVFLERMTSRLLPIAKKCIFFGIGNHETAFANHYHRNLGAALASNLGIIEKYGSYRGWAVPRFSYGTRRQTLKIFQYHGWSGGRSKGRKSLEAERELGARDADIFTLGHDHQPYDDIWISETLKSSQGRYEACNWPRAFINGGCWLGPDHGNTETPTRLSEIDNPSWASKKNFRPERVGGPILHLDVSFANTGCSIDFTIEKRSHG